MRIRSIILYIFGAILFFSCNNVSTSNKNKDLTKGKFALFIYDNNIDSLNRSGYGHAFYCTDTPGSNHPPMLFVKDTNRVSIDRPLWFRHLSTQTPFLIFPGDTIHIETNTNEQVIFHIKSNRERDNELNFFPNLIRKTGKLQQFPKDSFYIKVKNGQEVFALLNSIEEKKNRREQFLNDQFKKKNIGKVFYQEAGSLIEYAAISNKLNLIQANNSLSVKLKIYNNLFNGCVQTAKALPFRQNFMCTNTCYDLVNMATSRNRNGETRDIKDLINKMDFIMGNFDGPQKEYLLYGTVSGAILYYNINVPEALIRKYDSGSNNALYKKLIHNAVEAQSIQFSNAGKDNQLLLSDYKTKKTITEIIKSNKGNLVLLDFWASWCVPCRQEIPAFKKLEEKYSHRKIAFYAISIDANINDWKTALRNENIQNGTSMLLLNAHKASFIKQNGISSIPRYMLIGKDGKIIASAPPRPTDKALEVLLEKNL